MAETFSNSCIPLPGQWSLIQGCSSVLFPKQSLPPYLGGGLLQALVRDCSPAPQVTEHVDQLFQPLQFPSTDIEHKSYKLNGK